MTIEERIAQRIAELEVEMANFVREANTKLGQYQAALAELKRLIEPVEETVKE